MLCIITKFYNCALWIPKREKPRLIKRCSSKKALKRVRSNVIPGQFCTPSGMVKSLTHKAATCSRPPLLQRCGNVDELLHREIYVNTHFMHFSETIDKPNKYTHMHQEGTIWLWRNARCFKTNCLLANLSPWHSFSLNKMQSTWHLLLQSYEHDAHQVDCGMPSAYHGAWHVVDTQQILVEWV